MLLVLGLKLLVLMLMVRLRFLVELVVIETGIAIVRLGEMILRRVGWMMLVVMISRGLGRGIVVRGVVGRRVDEVGLVRGDVVVLEIAREGDESVLRRELDGIRKEIAEDLVQLGAIGLYLHQFLLIVGSDVDVDAIDACRRRKSIRRMLMMMGSDGSFYVWMRGVTTGSLCRRRHEHRFSRRQRRR